MAVVKRVEIKKRISMLDTTKYQILTYCFFNNVQISIADLDCLTLLAMLGEEELTSFCKTSVEKGVFKSPQSARNAITKAEKKGLIEKQGKNKKTIKINDRLNIQVAPCVLLDFKILGQHK